MNDMTLLSSAGEIDRDNLGKLADQLYASVTSQEHYSRPLLLKKYGDDANGAFNELFDKAEEISGDWEIPLLHFPLDESHVWMQYDKETYQYKKDKTEIYRSLIGQTLIKLAKTNLGQERMVGELRELFEHNFKMIYDPNQRMSRNKEEPIIDKESNIGSGMAELVKYLNLHSEPRVHFLFNINAVSIYEKGAVTLSEESNQGSNIITAQDQEEILKTKTTNRYAWQFWDTRNKFSHSVAYPGWTSDILKNFSFGDPLKQQLDGAPMVFDEEIMRRIDQIRTLIYQSK